MRPIQHLDSHRGAFSFSAVGLYEVDKKLSYVLLATETVTCSLYFEYSQRSTSLSDRCFFWCDIFSSIELLYSYTVPAVKYRSSEKVILKEMSRLTAR